MEFVTEKIMENVWTIAQRGVRAFLLVGADRAFLVDSCFGGDIRAVCETLTDKPITLLTTHADPDHTGCDHQFSAQYLHPDDFALYERRRKQQPHARPMREGDVFHVGDYTLEVIHIPGHTPGSVALLERQHRFLLSGDTVQAHCIFMHGDGRDLTVFRSSIEKLERLRQDGVFDTVYASHGTCVLPADIIPEHLALADALLNGTAVPIGPAPEWFPDTVKTYRHGRAQMFY